VCSSDLSFIANTSIYSPTYYSPAASSRLELSDIGLVGITVAGQTYQFGGSGIESNQGLFGGSFGGNRLSLNNETNLISNRYDSVKILTGDAGYNVNTWNFSNNKIIFPDNTYQNTAFTGTGIDQYARTTANVTVGVDATQNTNIASTDGKMQSAYNQANTGTTLAQAAYNQANTETVIFGWTPNTIIVANTAGYISNSSAAFVSANNTIVSNNVAATTVYGGTVYSNGQDVIGTSLAFAIALG
jgi:hypothetical protein